LAGSPRTHVWTSVMTHLTSGIHCTTK